MKRCKSLIFIVLSSLIAPIACPTVRAQGATINYYISPSGSDSNPCSLSLPCLTIAHTQTVVQAAIPPGATLGSYYFTITPTANSNNDLYYDLSLAPAGFWSHVRSDCGDIRVTSQDGVTQVPREISACNPTAHTGALYLGTASGTATAYRIYYGDSSALEPAAGSAYGKYNVWESAATLVAHMEDAVDSTKNQHTLVNHNISSVSAQIGHGYGFNGSTSYIDLVNSATPLLPATTAWTVIGWVNLSTQLSEADILGQYIGTGGNGRSLIRAQGAGPYTLELFLGSATGYSTKSFDTTATIAAGGWHQFAVRRNGGSYTIYLDAGTPALFSEADGRSLLQTGNTIGARTDSTTNYLPVAELFTGALDELRVYNRPVPYSEIAVMYANQNAPGSFWTTGAEIPLSSPCVTVFLRGGTYTQTTGLTFGAVDSGSSTACRVTWQAYPGETPIISGGRPISGWSLYSGSIYRAYVGTSWDFLQLYVNGLHMQRARGPSNPSGWTRTATGYTAPSSMSAWGNPTAGVIVNLGSWSIGKGHPQIISGNTITMSSTFWTNQQSILTDYSVNSTPSWIENFYELMAPNSWYLNRSTGYLYLWLSGGSPNDATVVAPVTNGLLTISNARHIQFGTPTNPLVLAYSNWTAPDDVDMGYLEEISGNYWASTYSDLRTVPGAITVDASQDIVFSGNQFSHMGSRDILLKGATSGVIIADNRFDDNAGGAIQVGTVGAIGTPVVQERSPVIAYNRISSGNAFDYRGDGAIFVAAASNPQVYQNEIVGTPWAPIVMGFGWDTRLYETNGVVSNNFIDAPCIGPLPLGSDCGDVYTDGLQSVSGGYSDGLLISENYMRGAGPFGLYPDIGSDWSTWTHNVVQGTWSYWLHIGWSNISNLRATSNFTDNAGLWNIGTNVTISDTQLISGGSQPFGTPQQAVICGAGVPGATACTAPTLWPRWQTGVGATWSNLQIGP